MWQLLHNTKHIWWWWWRGGGILRILMQQVNILTLLHLQQMRSFLRTWLRVWTQRDSERITLKTMSSHWEPTLHVDKFRFQTLFDSMFVAVLPRAVCLENITRLLMFPPPPLWTHWTRHFAYQLACEYSPSYLRVCARVQLEHCLNTQTLDSILSCFQVTLNECAAVFSRSSPFSVNPVYFTILLNPVEFICSDQCHVLCLWTLQAVTTTAQTLSWCLWCYQTSARCPFNMETWFYLEQSLHRQCASSSWSLKNRRTYFQVFHLDFGLSRRAGLPI